MTIAAGNRFKLPRSREAALRHAGTMSCAGRNGPLWRLGARVGTHGAAPALGNRSCVAELSRQCTILSGDTDVVPRPIRDHNFGATLFVGALGLLMLTGFLLSIVNLN
jgi:hypothetical protein